MNLPSPGDVPGSDLTVPPTMSEPPLDGLLASLGLAPVVPATPTEPLFSVIVRTQGRRPRSLAEALASVQSQTYSRYEILLLVHGDEDVAAAVRGGLPADAAAGVKQVLSVQGGGRSRPLNAGLDAAGGDYTCFLDDDDLARPAWLSAFAAAAAEAPGTLIRAVTETQAWTTDGGDEPVAPVGDIESPYPPFFDLPQHLSGNKTPICSVAVPLRAVREFGLRFDESLPVYEDWEFIVRLAMILGVTSVAEPTSLYRRLDAANAHSAHDPQTWHDAHRSVIERLSALPVLLPAGDAARISEACFEPAAGTRHQREMLASAAECEALRGELDALIRSPLRWLGAFCGRALPALRSRCRRPVVGLRAFSSRVVTALRNRTRRPAR